MKKTELTIFQLFMAVVLTFLISSCKNVSDAQENGIIPNKWQSFHTIDEDGWLGERVDLWRNHRMWYMIESDFLLSGFESRPGTHAWQGEHIGKWIHAATLAYQVTKDGKLKTEIDETVKRLVATQLPNGYLGTYDEANTFINRPENESMKNIFDDVATSSKGFKGGWDTWTHRYNLYGLLTYERCFPNQNIVDACRKMGDLLIEVYGEGKADLTQYGTRRGISATTLLESVMMLYERTLDKKYLDFAEHIVEMSENNPGLRLMGSMLENISVVVPGQGKAYQLMANLLGYLRLYRCTGKEQYLKTVLNAWGQIKEEHLLTTGGPWSRRMPYNGNAECFAKPEDFNPEKICVEVCSSVTWMQLNIHLFELTGLARYFNEVELTLNNALYQHQFTDGIDWNHHPTPNGMPQYVSGITCCASSGPRGLEMYSSHLAGKIGDSLIINSLAPASIELPKEYGSGILNIKGDFPIKSSAEIHFETLKNKNFTVEFRLPANTTLAGVEINGEGASAKESSKGFFELTRKWEKGDVLSIDMNYELRITNTRGEENKNWFAITYGPITLAQQIKDLSDKEPFDGENISFDKPDEILNLLSPLGKPNADNYFRVKNTDITLIPYYMTPNRELGIRTYFQYN